MTNSFHNAGRQEKIETKVRPALTPVSKEKTQQVPTSRTEIAGTLGEYSESSEVSEKISEGGDVKGDGAKQTKRDRSSAGTKASVVHLIFDEENLPPAPEMIRRIEQVLRSDIRKLEKQARYYKGNILRKADFHKLNETIGEIRKKNVMLKRLITLAFDALKKLFLQMFGVKKMS